MARSRRQDRAPCTRRLHLDRVRHPGTGIRCSQRGAARLISWNRAKRGFWVCQLLPFEATGRVTRMPLCFEAAPGTRFAGNAASVYTWSRQGAAQSALVALRRAPGNPGQGEPSTPAAPVGWRAERRNRLQFYAMARLAVFARGIVTFWS
jgi:hypothetical protein